MVSAGRMQLDGYLKLVSQYRHEPRFSVWESVLSNLGTLNNLSRGEPEQPLVRRFIIDFAKPKFAELGWDEKPGETSENKELRALLAIAPRIRRWRSGPCSWRCRRSCRRTWPSGWFPTSVANTPSWRGLLPCSIGTSC
jgi:hypothetical protein